jgi:hypothetical protein
MIHNINYTALSESGNIVEMNTLKFIALTNPVSHSHAKSSGKAGSQVSILSIPLFSSKEASQNFHGLVLRLIEKEKELQNLQAEVDRLRP